MACRIAWSEIICAVTPDHAKDCAGWDLQRMQQLMDRVSARWDEVGMLPSRLPPDLQRRHAELYAWAAERGRARGWDPELGDDE